MPLQGYDRPDCVAIAGRPVHGWPDGARLAVEVGLDLEPVAFGARLGAAQAAALPAGVGPGG